VEDEQVALEKAAKEKAAKEKAAQEKAAKEQTALEQMALEQGTVATEHDDDNAENQKPGASRKRRRSVAHVPSSWLLHVITNGSSSVGAERSCR
jgi:type II secretory pathway pseudopilin PulG